MALKHRHRSSRPLAALSLTLALAAVTAATGEARGLSARAHRPAGGDSVSDRTHVALPAPGTPDADSLFGHSGKLRAVFVGAERGSFAIPLIQRLFGDSAVGRPGVYAVPDTVEEEPLVSAAPEFAFISLLPFSEKSGAWLGHYHLGYWPAERGRALRNAAYANPDGFIVVTPENEDTPVSEHFRLRDFLTHDQPDVWPKYLVLDTDLVDKLELVIATLEDEGIHVRHMAVMSGFRTPQYNAHGGEVGGRARLSRHMFGDAADVFVDNDGDGRMDDLNHDGRVDSRDARVIERAVGEVERRYPDLMGGVGVYRATHSHGPFAHVDVRGWRARWGRIG